MTATIAHIKVKSFSTWKKAFDSAEQIRTTSGAVLDHVYRDADDPNKVTVILKWNSLTNARKYLNSAAFTESLAKAGVEGKPVFSYLDEA